MSNAAFLIFTSIQLAVIVAMAIFVRMLDSCRRRSIRWYDANRFTPTRYTDVKNRAHVLVADDYGQVYEDIWDCESQCYACTEDASHVLYFAYTEELRHTLPSAITH